MLLSLRQGTILIAVNPLRRVPNPEMSDYMDRPLNPETPHPYAIAEVSTFRGPVCTVDLKSSSTHDSCSNCLGLFPEQTNTTFSNMRQMTRPLPLLIFAAQRFVSQQIQLESRQGKKDSRIVVVIRSGERNAKGRRKKLVC